MYIQVDEDFQEHPKARRLCRILMDARGWSWCLLLWRYCTKFHPDGDLTDVDPLDLEYNLGWTLDGGKLFDALLAAGFIDREDGKTCVHDWMEYQGAAIVRMRAERERKKAWRASGSVPSRRIEDESDTSNLVSSGNQVSVHGRSADESRTSAGRDENVRGTSVVSIAEHSKASETRSTTPAPVPHPSGAPPGQLSLVAEQESTTAKSPRSEHPPLMALPCTGGKVWNVTQEWLAKAKASYPDIDVLVECGKVRDMLALAPKPPSQVGPWLAQRLNLAREKALQAKQRGRPFAPPIRKTSYRPL